MKVQIAAHLTLRLEISLDSIDKSWNWWILSNSLSSILPYKLKCKLKTKVRYSTYSRLIVLTLEFFFDDFR